MRNITFIILIFIPYISYTQSINDLDAKNGFRNFKLGSSPYQIKNIVRKDNQFSKNPDVIEYFYTGTDINSVFNVSTYGISLSFYMNKLFSIRISFGDFDGNDFTLQQFNQIKSALENTYGKDWISSKIINNVINGVIWDGKKVRLELIRTNFNTKDTPPEDYMINGYIHIFDKKIIAEMYRSEF